MADTRLDRALAAILADPEDETARLAYYHRLADSELSLLLAGEDGADTIRPRVVTLDDARFALVFDSDERLAAFSDQPQPYAAMPGRVLVAELAGQGIGLGINLASDEAAFLMPAAAVDWLARALAGGPSAGGDGPEAFFPPALPDLAGLIADKLAGLSALAATAYLAGARLAGRRPGHVLVFGDALPAAHDALAKAAAEAIQFSGIDPATVELMFMSQRQIVAAGILDIADRIEISAPPVAARPGAPAAPGSDPARPPRLR